MQLSVEGSAEALYKEGKHKFYWIKIDCPFKLHERELHDTLGLTFGKEGVVKHHTKEEDAKSKGIRFALGSVAALRRVLMFRGDSLNVINVLPQVPI